MGDPKQAAYVREWLCTFAKVIAYIGLILADLSIFAGLMGDFISPWWALFIVGHVAVSVTNDNCPRPQQTGDKP